MACRRSSQACVSPADRSSTYPLIGRANSSGYTTSKWALRGLTKCAAIDFAPYGIRVNVVLPGLIDTAMVVNGDRTVEQAFTANAQHFLVPRLGVPADISQAVLFLASSKARYITGAEFVVDGGWTAW
jgi:3alpha(or 20beta)-hydroxysteroid dehydrogenase